MMMIKYFTLYYKHGLLHKVFADEKYSDQNIDVVVG